MSYRHRQKSAVRGFTLIELLITIALFSILISIAVGGFVQALRTQRDLSGMMSMESNANIALEEMTRELRTGYLFAPPAAACTSKINSGIGIGAPPPTYICTALQFYNAAGQSVTYAQNAAGALTRTVGASSSPMMGGNVSTTYLVFIISGDTTAKDGTTWPPRITISLGVAPSSSQVLSPINLQTTVSARGIFQ